MKVAQQYKPRIVVLRRQNVLKQAISFLNARRLLEISQDVTGGRGTAHILPEHEALIAELKKKPLALDFNELRKMLNVLHRAYAKLDHVAKAFGDVHNITYEDYLGDRDRVVHGVLEHIGIDPMAYQPADAYLKITSDSLEEVVENYDELKRFVAKTPFEAMA